MTIKRYSEPYVNADGIAMIDLELGLVSVAGTWVRIATISLRFLDHIVEINRKITE